MFLPRPLLFAVRFLIGFVVLGVGIRGLFHWTFGDGGSGLGEEVFKAYLLGARYDLRLGLVVLLPMLTLSLIRRFSPFEGGAYRDRIWSVYLFAVCVGWVVFHIFDFAHYSYLGTKLAASILNFLADPKESAAMVWQSYPVIKLVLLWIAVSGVLFSLLLREFRWAKRLPRWPAPRKHKVVIGAAACSLVVIGLHGRFSQYPLRWSDAYFNPNPFVAALALNPVLNFIDTRKYVGGGYSLPKVKAAYPRMAAYLGATHQDENKLDYSRLGEPKPAKAIPGRPNIVLVLLESFSAYKSSLSGNSLDPTPFLGSLARESVHFDHFYTPHSGTARGVFATLSGLPDVDLRNTSSRNPAAVDQHSLANALPDYETHYFIGGSTSWANVRGVIQKNIPGLVIHEEGSFKAPVVDVWGISDKSLFLEANEVFRQAKRPFFSVIQTAGNHRPYTIPKTDTDFELRDPGEALLKKNGFASVDEFNAFRYMDYCVKAFIEQARKEAYFENTVFVFLGDHGIAAAGHDVGPHMPRAYLDLKLSAVHTPLVIHAPKYLKPARYSKIGSQIDVMPTVLGLTGFRFLMTGLGRDLLDSSYDDRRHAFTIYHDGVGEIGLLNDHWYYMKKASATSGTLHALDAEQPSRDLAAANPDVAARMNLMLDDYYQTALYMLTNNRQRPHPPQISPMSGSAAGS